MVLWLPERTHGGEGLARLDRLTSGVAKELNCSTEPLFTARDETLSWAWLPFGSHREVPWDLLSSLIEDRDPTARAAVGDVESGVEGFRRTHRQALRAHELAMAASPGARVTAYAQVAPIALMCTDIDGICAWVRSVLGALAVDDEHICKTPGDLADLPCHRLQLHRHRRSPSPAQEHRAVPRPESRGGYGEVTA
jgi:hypothetical protein